MEKARILIIGAGCSGISSAAKLSEKGFKNIQILEAESRIGGRLYTKKFASNVVDLGAQWCHGEEDNSIFNLVNNYKVLDESTISYPNVYFLRSTGVKADNEKCGRLVMLCSEILDNCTEDLKEYKGSLGSYFVQKYKDALTTPDYADIDSVTAMELLEYFHKFENSIEASDSWYDTSGNGYLQYWECEGHPLLNWRDKGYGSVLDYIMKKKPDPANDLQIENKIKLNKEVNNISWNDPSRNHLVVNCSDGSSYDADHVIVTVSLGVLKENYQKMFTPKLPQLKVNAIEGLSIGTVDKIFLEFSESFWEKDWAGFSLLWTHKDSEEIRKTSNAWLEDIFGFYKVDYQPNILCGWIGGAAARRMEQLDDETVLNGCMFLFEKFLGKTMKYTNPVRILRSNWYSNKHFRGSYSFRSITTDLLKTSASHLAMPLYDALGKPVLMFAGEATSDHYYSTVHGALDAGYREADRIYQFYNSITNAELVQRSLIDVPNEKYYDVIILGAGISGLAAGRVLKSSNVSFTILEASSRVGGRIHTINMKKLKNDTEIGPRVEAGAQWLHGKNNDLYEYASKYNFIRPELSEEAEGDYIRDDGTKFDDFFVKKVDFKFGQILEECEEFVNYKNDTNFKFPQSLAEYVERKFKDYVQTLNTEEEKSQALQLLDWHRKFQIIDNSCFRFDDISAKDWGNYSFNGESCQTHINVNEMGRITSNLHDELNDEIKLNHIVDYIYWKNEEYPGKSNRIKIVTRNGETYITNNLICTFSLGVLKIRHLEIFNPPLPKQHQDVIENIGFGTINKIFLHFDQKWWEDDWKGLQLVWQEDLNEKSHWTQYMTGFDVVYPSPQNTLIGWIGGKGAIDMEKLSDIEIARSCIGIIRKFLKRPDIPEPTHFFTSRWKSNEFIGGAYSFTSRHTDHIKDWEKILAQPIIFESSNYDKNIILMAGEACHEQYFSTVHGAFLSGIDQAKNILKLRTRKMTKNLTFLSKL